MKIRIDGSAFLGAASGVLLTVALSWMVQIIQYNREDDT